MKDIPKHFVSNNDKVGDCNFDLVKREGNVYMYHRTNMDGSHRSYEVFISKFIAKGSPLPNGTVESEDRMQYPGSNVFGKTAYDCSTLDRAELRFDELVAKSKQQQINRDEAVATGKPMRRGRSASKKVVVQIPSKGSRFTMKQLIADTGLDQPYLYQHIKRWIEDSVVSAVDTIRAEGGRGRPAVVYMVN